MHRRNVLARDLPVFREQRMPSVLFFRDERPAPLADRLMDLVNLRQPTSVAELPTWSDCVNGLLREIGLPTETPQSVELPLRKAS